MKSVDLGSSVKFSCNSSILSSVTYQWEHNETSILNNETSEILQITDVQWNKTGVYHCIVTTESNVSVKSNKGDLTVGKQSAQLYS